MSIVTEAFLSFVDMEFLERLLRQKIECDSEQRNNSLSDPVDKETAFFFFARNFHMETFFGKRKKNNVFTKSVLKNVPLTHRHGLRPR